MSCEKTTWSVLPRRDKDPYQMNRKLLGVFYTYNRPENLNSFDGDLLILGPCYLGILGLQKTKRGGTSVTKRTVVLPEKELEKPAKEWKAGRLSYVCCDGENRTINGFFGEDFYLKEVQLGRYFQTLVGLFSYLKTEDLLVEQPKYTMVINGVSRFGPIQGFAVKKLVEQGKITNLRLIDVGERLKRMGEPPDW